MSKTQMIRGRLRLTALALLAGGGYCMSTAIKRFLAVGILMIATCGSFFGFEGGFIWNHFYTADSAELKYAVQSLGFEDESTLDPFYVFPRQIQPAGFNPLLVQVHRLFCSEKGDHYYTTDPNQIKNITSKYPCYQDETDSTTKKMLVFDSLNLSRHDKGSAIPTKSGPHIVELRRFFDEENWDHFMQTHRFNAPLVIPPKMRQEWNDGMQVLDSPVKFAGVTAIRVYRAYHRDHPSNATLSGDPPSKPWPVCVIEYSFQTYADDTQTTDTSLSAVALEQTKAYKEIVGIRTTTSKYGRGLYACSGARSNPREFPASVKTRELNSY